MGRPLPPVESRLHWMIRTAPQAGSRLLPAYATCPTSGVCLPIYEEFASETFARQWLAAAVEDAMISPEEAAGLILVRETLTPVGWSDV